MSDESQKIESRIDSAIESADQIRELAIEAMSALDMQLGVMWSCCEPGSPIDTARSDLRYIVSTSTKLSSDLMSIRRAVG